MLGSLAVPSFLEGCAGSTADKAAGISFALNHFGLSESDMKKVLNAALEKGGEDVYKRQPPIPTAVDCPIPLAVK